jgi:hypothetical protein
VVKAAAAAGQPLPHDLRLEVRAWLDDLAAIKVM